VRGLLVVLVEFECAERGEYGQFDARVLKNQENRRYTVILGQLLHTFIYILSLLHLCTSRTPPVCVLWCGWHELRPLLHRFPAAGWEAGRYQGWSQVCVCVCVCVCVHRAHVQCVYVVWIVVHVHSNAHHYKCAVTVLDYAQCSISMILFLSFFAHAHSLIHSHAHTHTLTHAYSLTHACTRTLHKSLSTGPKKRSRTSL
jgi:hypothetical protein